MKFIRTALVVFLYCLGLAHAVSCAIRVGRAKKIPVFPGQVWSLPGVGNVLVTQVVGNFTYYEIEDDNEKTWCCRTSTFQDFAQIVSGKPTATPVEHLISKQENNVIHLKKDEKNDRV